MNKDICELNSELRKLRVKEVLIGYFVVFSIGMVCIISMICNKLPSVGSLKGRKYATKLRTTRNFSKLFG